MNESLIAGRYATALFSLAKEKNLAGEVKNDLELILTVYNESPDFRWLLKSPVVKPSEKSGVMKKIFGKKIQGLSLDFLDLTIKNNREIFIPMICRIVLDAIREGKNIKTAVITTAQALDKKVLKKAEKLLENELQSKVELQSRVNPRFIGGMVLRIDDRQYDATVSTQLKKLKQEFLKTQL